MAQYGTTEKTNELLGGQYFDPVSGSQLKPFVPVITPESVGMSSPLPQLPKEQVNNYAPIVSGIADSLSAESTSTPYTEESGSIVKRISELMGQTQGKEAFSQQALEESGVNAISKRQREITAELTRLNNETTQAQLIAEQQAGTAGLSTKFLNRQINEITKNSAIRALSLNSEYAMNAGNLETAKESAQRAVDLRYGDIEKEIDYKTKLLDLYSPFMSQEQKDKADRLALANTEKRQELADKKKMQQDLINFAQTQGDSATASSAIRLDPNSSTFNEDLASLQERVKIDQSDKIYRNLQIQKLQQEIAGEDTPINQEWSDLIQNAASAEGTSVANDRTQKELTNLANSGNLEELNVRLKNQVKKMIPSSDRTELLEAEKQIKALDRMQKVISQYEAAGGKTGFLKGTSANISKRIGQLSTDPKFAEIATELDAAFQQYRQNMTGAAFGARENAEYKKVMPTADKSYELNVSIMKGLRNYLSGNVESTYEIQLGSGYTRLQGYLNQNNQLNVKEQAVNAGFDYDAMRADGYSDEEILNSIR